MTQGFWLQVKFGAECWEWQGNRSRKGYGRYGKKRRLTHRIMWEFFYGPIPDGLFVLHHCDNPPCIRPSHLWLGTNLDNVRDRIRKGRPGSTGRPRKTVDATLTHNSKEAQ